MVAGSSAGGFGEMKIDVNRSNIHTFRIRRKKKHVKISSSDFSANCSASCSGLFFLFSALKASCNLTIENMRSAKVFTEKNNVPPARKQMNNTAHPV
jgi:hypothetical protein